MHVTLTIDNREHDLIRLLKNIEPPPLVAPLEIGDILFSFARGDDLEPVQLIMERKSLADLKASIRDGRYREQKGRLQATSPWTGYIIEGNFVIGEEDASVVGAILNTVLRDKMFVLFPSNIRETAIYIQEIWKRILTDPAKYLEGLGLGGGDQEQLGGGGGADWIHTVKTKKRRVDNIDPSTSTMLMLSQIPGVSSHLAQNIYRACCTAVGSESIGMAQLVQCLSGQAGVDLLKTVPQVGPKKINTIREYLGLVAKN